MANESDSVEETPSLETTLEELHATVKHGNWEVQEVKKSLAEIIELLQTIANK